MAKDESKQKATDDFGLPQNTHSVFWEDKLKQNALTTYNPRIFLVRALSHGIDTNALSDADVDSINEQIAAISHILVRNRVRDFSSQNEIVNTLADAFCLCSIGLEYGSVGDLLKATKLILKNELVKFFRIGNTLINKLHRKAAAVKEKSVLTLPKKDFFSLPDELELYSTLEKQFIATLINDNKTIIDHADMEIETNIPAQLIGTLSDISIAENMLDNLALREEYMRFLLMDGIAPEIMLDIVDNPARKITQALIINVALHQQVKFHVEMEDLARFREVCCDSIDGKVNETIKKFLLKWIENYFEYRVWAFEEDDESLKKYAVDYWQYCIEKLRKDEISWAV